MPRVRRRAIGRREKYEDSPRVIYYLLTGHDAWFFFAEGPELDDEMVRAVWDDWRGELLRYHVFGTRPPGWDDVHGPKNRDNFAWNHSPEPFSRPWAWWKWDAPEPRRWIGSSPPPLGPADWFGIPSLFDGAGGLFDGAGGVIPEGAYESERDYLLRLPHLLLPKEGVRI